jgi:hypothetical protein
MQDNPFAAFSLKLVVWIFLHHAQRQQTTELLAVGRCVT